MLTPTADSPRLRARHAVLASSFGLRTDYEREASIDELFTDRARERPDAIAVVAEGLEITYAQLRRDAEAIAVNLQAAGVGPGATVGIALGRSPYLPAALLGVLRAGAAYVPLDAAYPQARLASMVEDASVEFVLTESDGAGLVSNFASSIAINKALAASGEPRSVQGGRAESLAYVMYTSGSTGRPKGVAIEHRGVVRLVRKTDYVEIAPGDTILQSAPASFDASTFEIWGALLNGARLAMPPAGMLTIEDLAETIERFEVTTLWLTAPLFRRFVDAGVRPASLRCVLAGGDIVSASHARSFLNAFPNCRLINGYGPTENTTFSTAHAITLADTNSGAIPIGRPIANSSAYVVDENLDPVPMGEAGELCVGGDGVARGYLNEPKLSAERFVADPFALDPAARLYRTGDRVRFRADGILEFLGRSDNQVKVRGHRIELGEIEAVLRAYSAIRDAAVVAVERDGEKDIVAHVIVVPASQTDESSVRAHLRNVLPPFMLPHRLVLRRELPLTPGGKVDRVALVRESPEQARPPAPRFFRDRSEAREQAIATIWREVLGSEREPGLDENFFDAGGDSLRLLAVRKRLRERLGFSVSATDLFEQTTIRRLAAFLAATDRRS